MGRKAQPAGIRAIAKRARLSLGAVSMALRDDPSISAETRERVKRIAEELGYRRHARVGELMSLLKRQCMSGEPEVIALVLPISRRDPRLARLIASIERHGGERAKEQGYRLESFSLVDEALSGERLRTILRARGIRGVLFGPHREVTGVVDFDCTGFATAIFGHSVAEPRTHRVVAAHFLNVRMAMAQLRARGYRRVGFVTNPESDARSRNLLSSGFLDFSAGLPKADRVPILVTPPDRDVVRRWRERHKPDAVIVFGSITPEMVLGRREPAPEQVGVVILERQPELRRFAGVTFNNEVLAACAVDHVVASLRANSFGLPKHPQTISIEGVWVDGESVRPLRSPVEVPLFTPGPRGGDPR